MFLSTALCLPRAASVLLISLLVVGCARTATAQPGPDPVRPSPQSPPVARAAPAAAPPVAAMPQAVPRAQSGQIEVRFICISPSPYTNRHDAFRAGFGIYWALDDLITYARLPIKLSFYDGSEFFEDEAKVKAALTGADVLILGGATWNQGPTFYIRRFLEQAGATFLGGVTASAWATAGGFHTGGEEVVASTLRSMMGMGATVFTLGQKYMVFSTDERIEPSQPGAFSLLDVYYMDQFARYIAVTALSRQDRTAAKRWAESLQVSPFYFLGSYPHSNAALAKFRGLQSRINAAADPNSVEYRRMRVLLTQIK